MVEAREVPLSLDKNGTVEITKGGIVARVLPESLPAFLSQGWSGNDADGNPYPTSSRVGNDNGGKVAISPPSNVDDTEEDTPTIVLPEGEVSSDGDDDVIWVEPESVSGFVDQGWTVDEGQDVTLPDPDAPKNSQAGLVKVVNSGEAGEIVGYVTPESVSGFESNGWVVAPDEEQPRTRPQTEEEEAALTPEPTEPVAPGEPSPAPEPVDPPVQDPPSDEPSPFEPAPEVDPQPEADPQPQESDSPSEPAPELEVQPDAPTEVGPVEDQPWPEQTDPQPEGQVVDEPTPGEPVENAENVAPPVEGSEPQDEEN